VDARDERGHDDSIKSHPRLSTIRKMGSGFLGKADIDQPTTTADSVENDPERTSHGA